MSRLLTARFPALVALICTALLAGCSGNGDESPVPTPGETALSSESTPAPGNGAFVYSTEVRSTTQDARYWPTRAVVVFDPGSGNGETLFEYGEVGNFPVREVLSGNTVFYATEKRIAAIELDGSGSRGLFTVTDELQIGHFEVSPDGRTIALSIHEFGGGEFHSQLILLDARSGEELKRIDAAEPAYENFVGYFARVSWQPDGAGLVVQGATASEQPGGLATVRLDGTATIHDVAGMSRGIPTPRLMAALPWAGHSPAASKARRT